MKRVERAQILDYQTYADRRELIRSSALAAKSLRRIHVGEVLTFLFENSETVQYQIQEMIRVEKMAREADILHEISTYNELIGEDGDLGCTLLIEIDDKKERDEKLTRWHTLPAHIYAELPGGERVRPPYDARQISERRVSAVQYLKFPTAGRVPVAIGVDHPELTARTELEETQRRALAEDLST